MSVLPTAYHGTAARYLPFVLKKGIRPRGEDESHWEYASRPDLVYMTTAYPFYFGMHTAEEDEKTVVFEVDLDHLAVARLLPDEDFIAQAISRAKNVPLAQIHNMVRDQLENWQDFWQKSIEHLGNVCFKGTIPPQAITRYCLFEAWKRPHLAMRMLDPCISIDNYQFCGEGYRQIVEWMFGDRDLIPTNNTGMSFPSGQEVDMVLQEQQKFWEEESKNRTGIEVHAVI